MKTIQDAVRELNGEWPSKRMDETVLMYRPTLPVPRYEAFTSVSGHHSCDCQQVCTYEEWQRYLRLQKDAPWDTAPSAEFATKHPREKWWTFYKEIEPDGDYLWCCPEAHEPYDRWCRGTGGIISDPLVARPGPVKPAAPILPKVGSMWEFRDRGHYHDVTVVTHIDDGVLIDLGSNFDPRFVAVPPADLNRLTPLRILSDCQVAFEKTLGFIPTRSPVGDERPYPADKVASKYEQFALGWRAAREKRS